MLRVLVSSSGAGVSWSEVLRRVLRAGQPSLRVVALGDDSGDALPDASQRALHVLRHVAVHGSSSVCGYLFAVTIEFRRKTPWPRRRKSLFRLLRWALGGAGTGLARLSKAQVLARAESARRQRRF